MSELRDECYKCLNNQNCISGADYGSFYCMTRRKFKMPEQEDDSVYATKFAVMQKQINEKDKRIKELEEELYSANKIVEEYTDSIPRQKVKDVLQNNRNEIFSFTYVDDEQFKPYTMQIDRINKIEKELLEEGD